MSNNSNFYKIDKELKKYDVSDDIEIVNRYKADKNMSLPIDSCSK